MRNTFQLQNINFQNTSTMYLLDNTTTGEARQIEDVNTAIAAFENCPMECELRNEDGDLIASKDFMQGMDGDELETHWAADDARNTSVWMRKEWIARHLKKKAA